MNVSKNNSPSRNVDVARMVAAFWLLGWLIKAKFFVSYLFHEIILYPVGFDFFPAFFRSPSVVQFFYILPLFILPVFLRSGRFYFYFSAIVMMVSSVVLGLHQDTYNDATFVSSFWVSLWFMWFVTQMHREDDAFTIHARSLALCVVGLVFWGGFVGKLTPEYYSGSVLANIFLQQDYGVVGQWVRQHFSVEAIRFHFQWISKMMILGEGFLALSPFLPCRIVCMVGIPFMMGISLFTTWRIFSVLFCLIGLLVACWRLDKLPLKRE